MLIYHCLIVSFHFKNDSAQCSGKFLIKSGKLIIFKWSGLEYEVCEKDNDKGWMV